MPTLPGSITKAGALVTPVCDAIGEVRDHYLTAEQCGKADALIDAALLAPEAGDADKLVGCMIKAYLRLPQENGNIRDHFARFAEAGYEVSNNKVEQNGRMATADHAIAFGSLPSDGWSVCNVIGDALSKMPRYAPVAAPVAKQMAMLVYAGEKLSYLQNHAFDTLENEFRKAGIAPFKEIRLLEFAGRTESVVANEKRGLAKLLGAYKLYRNVTERASDADDYFVSLDNTRTLPGRDAGFGYVIARNIFNVEAVEDSVDARRNAQQLLCVMSNLLPDKGRLYISTSIPDALDMAGEQALLSLAGFKPATATADTWHVVANSRGNSGKSCIFERDYQMRGESPVVASELHALTGGQLWEKRTTAASVSSSLGV